MQLKHIEHSFHTVKQSLLMICTLYIHLLSNPDETYSFHNLAGLATAAGIVVYVLNKLRTHPFMYEVVYVWDLKQQLNHIPRKQRKIEAAVENNDHETMVIINFQYRGSKQLYELDDNTITMQELASKIRRLNKHMKTAALSLSTDLYKPTILDRL